METAQEAFAARRWTQAVERYTALASHDGSAADGLDAADSEQLAVAAYMVGRDETCRRSFERAHRLRLEAGDIDGAVRCGFWVGFTHMIRGAMAPAGGWLGTMAGLVAEHDPAGPGRGYLLIPAALRSIDAGDLETATDLARTASDLADTHADQNLAAFATLVAGQALIRSENPSDGTARFDEAMVAVTTGEVSPIICGVVYCAVVDECVKVLDVRRAAEWTEALTAWCADQPDLVPYRGQCLVHRSQMLQLQGSWIEAAAEADQARFLLADPLHPALGLACYQRGELHRLRGEHDEAEAAYREASRHGHQPLPGLPLLRLAQGRLDDAAAGIARAVAEPPGLNRTSLLAAAVEIHGAAGDLDEAARACADLTQMAETGEIAVVAALAAHAAGTLARLSDDPAAALAALRDALVLWRELDMPYEAARTREQLGLACRAAGDRDGCELELEAARFAYNELGAVDDLVRLAAFDTPRDLDRESGPAGGLTGRELEVLRLVATGRTNREISADLVISEHTVARHVQNIFAKIGVSSRTAATSFAYQHDLV